MTNLRKKVLIIGASSGIGRELALKYAKENYIVGIASRRKNLLREIKKAFPSNIIIEQLNVQNRSVSNSRISSLIKKMGGVDIAIISSGIGERNKSMDFGIDKNTISTNIYGFTSTINYIYKHIKKQGGGQIAAISSIAGIRGNRWALSYGASKAYQINYLEGLRAKAFYEKANIKISDIRAGFVKTKMAKGPGVFFACSAQKAACQIYRSLKKKRDVVYVSRRWRFIAILIKIFPRFIINRI